jgi:hypothetical protein
MGLAWTGLPVGCELMIGLACTGPMVGAGGARLAPDNRTIAKSAKAILFIFISHCDDHER